ncbi:MAG: DUF4381 domain-containing protein [Gammaproteobacteria bacterium]|nr:DUF4381 domain-containing protein [Gammaproteobacteria bacterium]
MNELPLRDIHLPDTVSWWPLAIGWWLLPLLVLLISFAIYRFIKYKKQNRKIAYKKIALNELKDLRLKYKNNDNSVELIRAVSALLRRIALSYLPREDIASLTGQQWTKQLNRLCSQNIFIDEIALQLENAPYKPQSNIDNKKLLATCESWIQALPETRNSKSNKP